MVEFRYPGRGPSAEADFAVLEREPLLDAEMLELALWLKERAFCTVFDAVHAMLPTGLYLRVKPVYQPGGDLFLWICGSNDNGRNGRRRVRRLSKTGVDGNGC